MILKSLRILQEAEVLPLGVLGEGRIANRDALLAKLADHRQMLTRAFAVLYVCAVGIAIATVVMVLRVASPITQLLAPLLGGASFIGLLAFARYLTKDWMICTLPLVMAEHASDDQLADLITGLLSGFARPAGRQAAQRGPRRETETSEPAPEDDAPPGGAAASTGGSKIVIVSAPEDRPHLELLRRHLLPLKQAYGVEIWDEMQIPVGARFRDEISAAVAATKLAILLVSVDLLGSQAAHSLQLAPLLKGAKDAGATIIPIIAGPCGFAESALAEFRPANPPERPLSSMKKPEREELLQKVAVRVIELTKRA